MLTITRAAAALWFGFAGMLPAAAGEFPAEVREALLRAGANRAELEAALAKAPEAQRPGLEFLIGNMPDQDLRELSAEFLLETLEYAYRARDEVPWGKRIPPEVFLNEVLPYASVNERRERWRKEFHDRFLPLVKDCPGPGKAAAILNGAVFRELQVRYSTERPKADQAPAESIAAGKATCTGLSILLVAACRSVGVPARFAGTPLWVLPPRPPRGGGSNGSGNHSWVEVWDGSWHFTGACEPTGEELDRAFFTGLASKAVRDHPRHAIYATSFRKTPLPFPLVWAQRIDWVNAVNVTDRYTALRKDLPPGRGRLSLRVLERRGGRRLAASVRIAEADSGAVLFSGESRDESFDLNDHLTAEAPLGRRLEVEVSSGPLLAARTLVLNTTAELQTITLEEEGKPVDPFGPPDAAEEALARLPESPRLDESLRAFFTAPPGARAAVEFEPELDLLLERHPGAVRRRAFRAYREARATGALLEDFRASRVTFEGYSSPYVLRAVGRMPPAGWPLFIAMHGGGGVPKQVNDSQWRHMQRYYRDQPETGGYLYLALRAPNDVWNGFYDWYALRLIENLIRQQVLLGGVDPDRVFVMGYSHGGYGAFHIGLNLADRFAAIHASASAPTEGNRPGKNLRNTPFTFMIGEGDTMYERLKRCQEFDRFIQELKGGRADIYPVVMELKAGHGHTGLPDRDKIRELYPRVRNPIPRRLTWAVGGTVNSFHWLHVPRPRGGEIEAEVEGNEVRLRSEKVNRLSIYLDERLVDLRKPVGIEAGGQRRVQTLRPSLRTLCETLDERGDPRLAFTVRVEVRPPPEERGF